MWQFIHDESGATTAKISLLASSITLLAYGWFHSGGTMIYSLTDGVTSAMTTAIRRLVGGTFGY